MTAGKPHAGCTPILAISWSSSGVTGRPPSAPQDGRAVGLGVAGGLGVHGEDLCAGGALDELVEGGLGAEDLKVVDGGYGDCAGVVLLDRVDERAEGGGGVPRLVDEDAAQCIALGGSELLELGVDLLTGHAGGELVDAEIAEHERAYGAGFHSRASRAGRMPERRSRGPRGKLPARMRRAARYTCRAYAAVGAARRAVHCERGRRERRGGYGTPCLRAVRHA